MNTEKNKKQWVSPQFIDESVQKTNSGGVPAYTAEGSLPSSWPTSYGVYYAPLS